MLVITIARKPLKGTVAANSLVWGCGGINIDASRIGIDPTVGHPRLGGRGSWETDSAAKVVYEGGYKGDGIASSPLGRWPANFLLSHLSSCTQRGNATIKTNTHYPASRGGGGLGTSGHKGQPNLEERSVGKEGVASWVCHSGCPVAALDEQSGLVQTGTWNRQTDTAHPFGDAKNTPYETWQESPKEAPGGASRYFKVVVLT